MFFPCNYRPRPCKRSLADAVKQTHYGGICPKKDQVCCPGTVWYEYVGKCLGKFEPKVLIQIIPFKLGQHDMVYHTYRVFDVTVILPNKYSCDRCVALW